MTETPEDVEAMLRLEACGWGVKRTAREVGCSRHTVRQHLASGGVKPFRAPQRPKKLDGLEARLQERFVRHAGNADVVRQDLQAEHGIIVSARTMQRAVADIVRL